MSNEAGCDSNSGGVVDAAFCAVVVVIFAAGTLWNLYDEQLEAIDVELAQDALRLREQGDVSVILYTVDHINVEHPWKSVAVLAADGERLDRSTRISPELVAKAQTHHGTPVSLKEGDSHWRLQVDRTREPTLALGYSLEEADDTLAELVEACGLSLPVVLVLVGAGGWWVAGRALAPIVALTRAVEAVQANRLDARVTPGPVDDEIGRLARVFNAMLERTFAQSQRFAADASHELRTLLTVMRSEVERGLRDEALQPIQMARLVSLQEEVSHLDRITANLLLLSSFDSGRRLPTAELPV